MRCRSTFLILFVLHSPIAATEPNQPSAKPMDRNGDPLPDGAIARLGSTRFLTGQTFHMRFSPDGKRLMTSGIENVHFIWDAESGRQLAKVRAHESVHVTVFSPDGKNIVTAEYDRGLFLRSAVDGKEIRVLEESKRAQGGAIAWASDCKRVAAAIDRSVVMWDIESGKRIRVFEGHKQLVSALAISPDGKLLVSAGFDGTYRVWDLTDGSELRQLAGRVESSGIAISPDGKTVAGLSASFAGLGMTRESLYLWSIASGRRIRDLNMGTTSTPSFSPDGQFLAAGGYGVVHLWNVIDGTEPRRFSTAAGIEARVVAFSADSKQVAAVVAGRVRIWNVATGAEQNSPSGHVGPANDVVFSPDGSSVVSCGLDRTIRTWDWVSGREVRRWDNVGIKPFGVKSLSYSPNGQTLISVEGMGERNDYTFWEAKTGVPESRITAGTHASSIAFAPDGETFLSAEWDGSIGIWHLDYAKLMRRSGKHPEFLRTVSPSADGKRAAWVDEHGGFGIRELESGKDSKPSGDDNPHESWAAFTPDGSRVATLSRGSIRFWHPTTMKLLAEWEGVPLGSRSRFAFSPDGRLLAASSEKEVVLYEVGAGREIRRFSTPSPITSLAFEPRSRALATALEDGTTLIWDLTGGLVEGKLPLRELKSAELERFWRDLAGSDAVKAHQAVAVLAADPASISFLQKRFRSWPIEIKGIDRLIADLSDEEFTTREMAEFRLLWLGDAAAPALRSSAKSSVPEITRRSQSILRSLDRCELTNEHHRELRSIAIFELAGSAESRRALQQLAAGAEKSRLTEQARAALQRLDRAGIK